MQPYEIYNLAGQTSVGSTATLNLFEVIGFLGGGIHFFSAGRLECFGDTGQTRATEDTPMRPGSPCEVANHRSCLGPKRFVTQKIIEGVKAIKRRISPATF